MAIKAAKLGYEAAEYLEFIETKCSRTLGVEKLKLYISNILHTKRGEVEEECLLDKVKEEEQFTDQDLKDEIEAYKDPKLLHLEYQQLKQKFEAATRLQILGDNSPEDIFSWQIKNNVYRSNEDDVILVKSKQDLYASIDKEVFRDLEIIRQNQFRRALENGIKRIKEKFKDLYELVIDADDRIIALTIYVNPEGKKLILFDQPCGHEAMYRIREKVT